MSPNCHCSSHHGYVWEACQSLHWIHGVEMKQCSSCGLACGVSCGCLNLLCSSLSRFRFFGANLAGMSPIGHCSSHGYVWEACQSIHWIHGVEMKQCSSCGLVCGFSCGCLNLLCSLISAIGADFWCKFGRNESQLSLQQPSWICLGSMSISSLDPWSGDETVQFMWFSMWGKLWLFKFALNVEQCSRCRFLVQIWPE